MHEETLRDLYPYVKSDLKGKVHRAIVAAVAHDPAMAYRPDHIAATIQRLADQFGSQRKLAAAAGLDPKTINNAVRGVHGLTVRNAYRIATAGGISITELLGEPRGEILADLEVLQALHRLLEAAERAADAVELTQKEPPAPRATQGR